MKKPRLKVTYTFTREYDADPRNYPSDCINDMIQCDQEAFEDDPLLIMEFCDVEREVKVEDISDGA